VRGNKGDGRANARNAEGADGRTALPRYATITVGKLMERKTGKKIRLTGGDHVRRKGQTGGLPASEKKGVETRAARCANAVVNEKH